MMKLLQFVKIPKVMVLMLIMNLYGKLGIQFTGDISFAVHWQRHMTAGKLTMLIIKD